MVVHSGKNKQPFLTFHRVDGMGGSDISHVSRNIVKIQVFLAGRENKIISQMNISPHLGVVDDLFFSKPNYRAMQLYYL